MGTAIQKEDHEIGISIILFVKNNKSNIARVIASLVNQTYLNFEVFIVCDSEINQYNNLIVNDKHVNIFHSTELSFTIDLLHSIVLSTKGKYIVLIDEHTTLLQDRLKIQYNYMESHLHTDVCSSYVNLISHNQCFTHACPTTNFEISCALLSGNPIFTWSVIIRSEKLKIVLENKEIDTSGLDLNEVGNDIFYLLWVNMQIQGGYFEALPECLSQYNDVALSVPIFNRYFEHICDKIIQKEPKLFNDLNLIIDDFNCLRLNTVELINKTNSVYTRAYLSEKNKSLSEKKKILICMQNLGRGGAEKLLIDILQLFDYTKYHIDLLLLRMEGYYYRHLPEAINCFSLAESNSHLLDTYDIEIAFLEGPCTKYIADRRNNARKLAWVHIDLKNYHWTKSFFTEGEELKCYRAMDKIVFVGEDTKKEFNYLFDINSDKQIVIPNLINKEEINRKKNQFKINKQGKLILSTVGRMHPQKAYKRLLPILNRLLQEHEFEFWFIGEGQELTELKQLVEEYRLEESIHFLGFCENPYPYIDASDIFVSCSVAEGFSLVVAEALCFGKPIVATRTAGPTELLGNGKYGLVVENNEESIYFGLKKMILNPELRFKFTQKALERSKIFDKKKSIKSIYELFD